MWGPRDGAYDPHIRTRARFWYNAVHLTAEFHRPMFNRLEVIVLTNRQTDKQKTDATENIHLAPL